MKFIREKIQGVQTIELMPLGDERGFFARAFCQQEFADHGLPAYGFFQFSCYAALVNIVFLIPIHGGG
jgi:dTDP-4-dehydrorhamnose 3,5-epimerase-like enzyme